MKTAAGCFLLLAVVPVAMGCFNAAEIANCTVSYNATIARNNSKDEYCSAGPDYIRCLTNACVNITTPPDYNSTIAKDAVESGHDCDLSYLNWAERLGSPSNLLVAAAAVALLFLFHLA